ncbi:hypothetical protein [uncultured Bradyrhizobium sp.]|uniref:hypothetical protein n=1 Tax=uncultured Bradyrhizobium sp. TaxID=199684 RepID=UPI0035C94B3C
MTRWWRAYDGSIDHPKLLKLSDKMFRAWYTLQCVASANGGTLPPAEDIALRLRIKKAEVAAWITQLVAAKLMDNDEGVFRPHNWDSRQFQSDRSTERVQKHRNKKRSVSPEANGNVSGNVTSNTGGNVSETANETPPEQSRADSETEQSRADACAPIDEELKRKVAALQAGVSAHFVSRGVKIPNLERCRQWLADGVAAGTVLVAVETVLKRGTKPATLDYFEGPVRDAHAKAAPENLQIVPPGEFIVEGTLEWACWDRYLRETTGRGSPVTDSRHEGGIRRGWWRPSRVPDGYDEATGEKLPPTSEEDAA